jgi:tetratricopeptide (TPR) repeat protein
MAILMLMAACCVATPRVRAQSPDKDSAAGQSKPAQATQKPASSNPFPEDSSTVPVLPTSLAPGQADVAHDGAADQPPIPMAGEDTDPVRSPDDPAQAATSGQDEGSSSSLSGLEKLLPRPEDDQQDKKHRPNAKQPTQQEAASKDIEIGNYYLDRKNWKAALSRFESALVLDPENPDVYWGLAEAQHHLGDLASAKANYLKLLEYDPDGPHGRQARRELKDPAVENAKAPATDQPADAPK